MSALFHSELRKYFSTRMWWGMALAMFLVGGIFAAFTGAFTLYGELPAGPGDSMSFAVRWYSSDTMSMTCTWLVHGSIMGSSAPYTPRLYIR